MKEQYAQSDHELEQMAHDRDNIFRELEELRLLNQQLEAPVAALESNSEQTEDDPESNRPFDLHTLDTLIQKWIVEAKLPHHLTLTTQIHDSPLSKEN